MAIVLEVKIEVLALIFGLIIIGYIGVYIVGVYKVVQRKRKSKSRRQCIMVTLGSGGHTAEMLDIVRSLITTTDDNNDSDTDSNGIRNSFRQAQRVYVHGKSDTISPLKIQQVDGDAGKVFSVTRFRNVGQSLMSSLLLNVALLIRAILESISVVLSCNPQIVLCNGPAICVPICIFAKLFCRSRIVYIESFARVQSLSLTGQILYRLHLVDSFIVQWEDLVLGYPNAIYIPNLIIKIQQQ